MVTEDSTNDIAHLLGMLDPWYERNTLSLLNLPANVVCQVQVCLLYKFLTATSVISFKLASSTCGIELSGTVVAANLKNRVRVLRRFIWAASTHLGWLGPVLLPLCFPANSDPALPGWGQTHFHTQTCNIGNLFIITSPESDSASDRGSVVCFVVHASLWREEDGGVRPLLGVGSHGRNTSY